MEATHALSFSAAERSAIQDLADSFGADVNWDSPEPHPDLPAVLQLGEFAQVVGPWCDDEGGESFAFTVQKTGDPLQRFVRLGHDGHAQASGRTVDEALWSLRLGV